MNQYAEQIAAEEEKESDDILLSRFADETDLPDWYFIWFLRFDSFCFYQCVYFCKQSSNLKQFVSKEVMLDSICVTVFENVCFVDIAGLKFM